MSSQVLNTHRQPNTQANPQQEQQTKSINFWKLFRFANNRDYLFIGLGTLCSIIIGAAMPFFSLLWGNMTDAFKNPDTMVSMALDIFIQYILFGLGSIFGGWGMQYFWQMAGERQANQCRKQYIQSLMRQEIGWYETQQSSQIVTRFVSDTQTFQQAIGDKIALVIYLISTFISGLIISYTQGWKMTLVVLAAMPFVIFAWWLMEFYTQKRLFFEEEVFQDASGMSQEALQAIKIVKQLNGQAHQQKRFDQKIQIVNDKSFSFSIRQSLATSFSLFGLLFAFTLANWYGSECVQGTSNCPSSPEENSYSGGVVLTIFFGLIIPAINLNQLAPSLQAITQGKMAAARIYAIIDRQPQVKSPQNPICPPEVKGVIRFNNVTFSYPKDKSKIILESFYLAIDCKSSGIMGQSGCGKSTILQLIMRLYDPDSGVITLDGVDIRQLDLNWLRSQIGYVGQEPMLFSQSIRENLLIGKEEASDEEMLIALRDAEILDFITTLSQNIFTYVGAGGCQLSGGQKQRIAIARALIKNPTILLLDEATSALDRRNQRLIQHTLNKVIIGKISITVAHRLQTIKNCDKIYTIDKGMLLSEGVPKIVLDDNSKIAQIDDAIEDQLDLDKSASKSAFQKLILQGTNNFTMPDTHRSLWHSQHSKEEKSNKQSSNTYTRLFSFAEGKKITFIVGIISSLVHGLVMPSMGIHVARMLAFNLLYFTNKQYYSQKIREETYLMIATCVVGPIAIGLQHFTFMLIGNSMTNKFRQHLFRKALRLPMSWFQSKDNNVEKMAINLGADMITISHTVSKYFSHLCVALSSIVFGLLLAFFFEWRTALVSIGLIPLIGVSAMFQSKMVSGYLIESSQLYQQSSKILAEALNNFKTVLTFCSQKRTIAKYMSKIDEIQTKQSSKKIISGLIFGVSFFVLFLVYGLIFYLAAIFIRSNDLDLTNALSAVFLVLFSAIIAGNNAKSIPDLGRLNVIANKLFELLDLKDQDELQLIKGSKRISKQIKGDISFRNVSFKYDNRDEITLKNVSFDIKQGQKIGIVGSSGCGKSTILKLFLGFYQCDEGSIIIDGEPIEDYDIHCLRQHFCTVSQEPELFDETVEYNIIYNLQGVGKQQFYEATLKAKLVENRQSLQSEQSEHFFKHKVGPRGSHLSGGQKQRVAIARAILRRPHILLLDEATSALDKQNEVKVQECLEAVMVGRTSLNVTHKLETLGNSSRIFVFKSGEIVEEGSFKQLLDSSNSFYRLLNGLDH